MDDLISRKAAIDALNDVSEHYTEKGREWHPHVDFMVEAIKEVPSVQQWIPISEGPPKNDDWVIVTILDERSDTPFRYTDFGWYLNAADCWIVDAEQRTDVVAWMPLPKSWKG